MNRRNLIVLPLAVFMQAADADQYDQIDRTPPIVEALKTVTLQQELTALVKIAYERQTGNDALVQTGLVKELTFEFERRKLAGVVESYKIVCDATNNPQPVIDTGLVMLFVLWRAPNTEPGVYNRIFMGPEMYVRRLQTE